MSETETANGKPTEAAPKTTAIAKTSSMAFGARGVVIQTYDELGRFCAALARTGFFKGGETAEKVMVKIQYGAELGIPPMASMMNVVMIDGKPSLGASLVAARIEQSGLRKFKVKAWTAKGCTLTFSKRETESGEWEEQGDSTFDHDDAKNAEVLNKDNWRKWPKAMFFHRALTQGARAYCASVFFGAVYSPEELGAMVDESGTVIDGNTGEVVDPPKRAVRSATAEIAKDVGVTPPATTPPKPQPVVQDAEVTTSSAPAVDAGASAATKPAAAAATGKPETKATEPPKAAAVEKPETSTEPKPEPERMYIALSRKGAPEKLSETSADDVVWVTSAKGEITISSVFQYATSFSEKAAKTRAQKAAEHFGESKDYGAVRTLSPAQAKAITERVATTMECDACDGAGCAKCDQSGSVKVPWRPTVAAVESQPQTSSVDSGDATAPSPASPPASNTQPSSPAGGPQASDTANGSPSGSGTSLSLAEALLAMPSDDAAGVIRYVTGMYSKLGSDDYLRLQAFGRARWNKIRNMAPDTSMTDEQKVAFAEAMALKVAL